MYYGELVFASHSSVKPIYKNGLIGMFGKFLYSVSANDNILLYHMNGVDTGTVVGSLDYDLKIEKNIFKSLSCELCKRIGSKIADTIEQRSFLSDIEINYPYEEKYGILIVNSKVINCISNVIVKKYVELKYGEVVFETIEKGTVINADHNSAFLKLAGIVKRNIYINDILMLINDDTEKSPSLFRVDKILFRGREVEYADYHMRGYLLAVSCGKYAEVNESSYFVKV